MTKPILLTLAVSISLSALLLNAQYSERKETHAEIHQLKSSLQEQEPASRSDNKLTRSRAQSALPPSVQTETTNPEAIAKTVTHLTELAPGIPDLDSNPDLGVRLGCPAPRNTEQPETP